MFERAKAVAEKSRTTDTLKAGLLAASLITPFEHGPAAAAEIPREATWQQGSAELQRSAVEKLNEYHTAFVLYTDGSSDWIPVIQGQATIVRRSSEQQVKRMLEYKGDRSFERVCDIHTHPLQSIRTVYQTGPKGTPFAPPSGGDIGIMAQAKKGVFLTEDLKVDGSKIIDAVLTRAAFGITDL